MREIALNGGQVALVDDEDFECVVAHSWYFHAATGYVMGYVTHGRGRRPVYLHRFILGASNGEYVDHRNKDKLDNRRSNIRVCSQSENMLNGDMARRKSTSRYRGVSASRYRWRAIYCGTTLGYFDTEVEAARAYDRAGAHDAPTFAQFNFGRT